VGLVAETSKTPNPPGMPKGRREGRKGIEGRKKTRKRNLEDRGRRFFRRRGTTKKRLNGEPFDVRS